MTESGATDRQEAPKTVSGRNPVRGPANGAALAAILGAGIGSLAVGLFVILNEAGLYAAPGLYAPAGGVSGRMTFATVVWAASWAILHYRWNGRDIAPRAVFVLTLILIAVGLVLTFPPVWSIF